MQDCFLMLWEAFILLDCFFMLSERAFAYSVGSGWLSWMLEQGLLERLGHAVHVFEKRGTTERVEGKERVGSFV